MEVEDDGVLYRTFDAEWVRQTAPHLAAMRERLFYYFGPVQDSGLEVYIARDREDFLSQTGSSFPDWGVAAALPRAGRIILHAPGAPGWQQPYDQVVGHEYAHIYLHMLAGPRARIPRWLDEGFAMHAAFEWSIDRYLRLARAAWTNQLLRLDELESVNRFQGEKAVLAYTQSFAAYQFLQDSYGREGTKALVQALGRGMSLNQAFWAATGTGFDDFQVALVVDIRSRYSIISLVADTGLFWGLLALLIIVGWWVKKRRARDIQRRWRIEDRIHGEPDFNQYVDPDDDESWRQGS